jgi:hypothetical protein
MTPTISIPLLAAVALTGLGLTAPAQAQQGTMSFFVTSVTGRGQKARCAPIKPQIYCGKELSNYYKRLLLAGR